MVTTILQKNLCKKSVKCSFLSDSVTNECIGLFPVVRVTCRQKSREKIPVKSQPNPICASTTLVVMYGKLC